MINRASQKEVIGLYFILIVILGCASKVDKIKDQKLVKASINQTQINWIGNWGNRRSKRKLVEQTAREFEILNQGINVNIKYQEEFCNNCKDARVPMQDTIINMIRSGNFNWDIITLTQKYYLEIGNVLNDPEWGKKYLVNFGDFNWFRESHNPIVFDVKQYIEDMGGIFAGPLIEGRYFCLWYNNRIAKKIGLNIKSAGMTFDDLLGYIKQTYEYNQKTSDKIQIFAGKAILNPTSEIFNNLFLSALSSNDNRNVEFSKGMESLKRTLKAMEKLALFNPADATIIYSADKDPMLDGKALFCSYASSVINQWEADNYAESQNMLPAEFPIFEKLPMYYHGSYQSVWAVFKNATHREQAVNLMRYFCSNDVAEKWIGNTRNPTAIKVRLNASDIALDDITKFNVSIEKKYGTNIRNYDISQILFGAQTKIKLDATDVVNGNITADEYYNKIVKQVKKK